MDKYRLSVELIMDLEAKSEEEAEQIFWDNFTLTLDADEVNGWRNVSCKKIEKEN